MRQNPLRRISVRLTLWYGGILVALVAILSAQLYWQLDHSLRKDLDERLRETARAGLAFVELEGRQLVWEGTEPGRIIPDRLPAVEQRRDLVRLIDRSGRVVSAPPFLDRLPVGAAIRDAEAGDQELLRTEQLGTERVRVHTVPVRRKGRFLGILQVVTSLEPLHRTLELVAHLLWWGGGMALLFSLAVGQFLAHRALDPVTAISRAARNISATNLSSRLQMPDTRDELSFLAASFDEMLDRLEEAYRRQREFAADASHELRTPLALIKGEASFARRPDAGAQEIQSALALIEEEADRMTHLVEDLLLLARLDRGDLLRADPVGLDELAHEIVARLGRATREREVRLRVEVPGSIVVRGDEAALRRVFLNLVENALEHTSAGEICVRVAEEQEYARVEVIDAGCGIPAAECERVFDRFYRIDRARRGGGAGLGLALCREIVEAHGGSIRLESEVGRGTKVTFTLPLIVPISAP